MSHMRSELPPAHLTLDQFAEVERALKATIDQPSVKVELDYDGLNEKYQAVNQIDPNEFRKVNWASSYSLRVAGEDREVKISGKSLPDESHVLVCRGPEEWGIQIKEELVEIIGKERNPILQSFRQVLTDTKARRATILSTFLVTITIGPLVPGLMAHITPTLQQAIYFWIAVTLLLLIRFRDWVFPYIAVGGNLKPRKRVEEIALWAVMITLGLLLFKYITEPSVDLLAFEIFGTRYIIPGSIPL